VATRKAKIAAELDGVKPGEAPIIHVVAHSDSPQPVPRPHMSPYKKLLAERGRPSLNAPPARTVFDDLEPGREGRRGEFCFRAAPDPTI
jgi:hypothetical protein